MIQREPIHLPVLSIGIVSRLPGPSLGWRISAGVPGTEARWPKEDLNMAKFYKQSLGEPYDAEAFRKQYQGEFLPPDPKLHRAAQEYHDRCEFYDRVVCHGEPRHGLAMPANNHELRMIGHNARQVFTEVARKFGLSENELREAVRHYNL